MNETIDMKEVPFSLEIVDMFLKEIYSDKQSPIDNKDNIIYQNILDIKGLTLPVGNIKINYCFDNIISKSLNIKKELFNYWDDNEIECKIIPSKQERKYKKLKREVLNCANDIECYITKNNIVKVKTGTFCNKPKLCFFCALGRAIKQSNTLMKKIKTNSELKSHNWYYLVTTVKHNNSDTLENILEKTFKLKNSILKKIQNDTKRNRASIWQTIKGGITSVETTYTKNGWNVHINWLINTDREIYLEEKSHSNSSIQEFLKKRGHPIHYIKKIDINSEKALINILVKILKYILKYPESLNEEKSIEFYCKTHKKRFFSSFGNLRGKN